MSKAKQPRTTPAKARKSDKESRARGLASASAAMGEAAVEESARQPKAKSDRAKPKKPKTREGKKGLVLYIEPEGVLALRRLALDNDSDVQRMGRRALELLFAEYGRAFPSGTSRANAKT